MPGSLSSVCFSWQDHGTWCQLILHNLADYLTRLKRRAKSVCAACGRRTMSLASLRQTTSLT